MQIIDISATVKKIICFGLVGVLATALIIGYAEFKYWHHDETITLSDAKVVGTMVSVRILANGKVKELTFEDGAEVAAGDVIARLEVAITEEEIQQLENTVQLAKDNYATLAEGQWVKVPVQRERVTYPSAPAPSANSSSGGNVAKLKERAERMAELFEMGAVSAVQRDAAQRAYESALASGSSSYSYSAAPAPIVEYYTEYVDEFRPTPPEVLAGAEQAIRQAELSLNVARQEARETDVIAPVSGTIYYGVEVEQDLSAGESVARVGDSRELWIEAEVTEEIFDKIPLGKLATFTLDGRELHGTVMEKIKPDPKPEEDSEPVELPEIPTTGNNPGALIGDNPAETPQPSSETSNAETSAETPKPAESSATEENPQAVEAETETLETPTAETPAENSNGETPAAEETPAETPTETPQPPKIPEHFAAQNKPNDKFLIKISVPVERDFDCRPNTAVVVKIKLP